MGKYEAMFIIKADLSEDDRKTLITQITDILSKNNASITQSGVWAERRRLHFPIKKQHEGVYYLVNFNSLGDDITKMKYYFRLNENILRVLILAAGSKAQ